MGCCGSKEKSAVEKNAAFEQTNVGLSTADNDAAVSESETGTGSKKLKKMYSDVKLDPKAPDAKKFQGMYLGRVPVSKSQGDEVVRNANLRLRGQRSGKPQLVTVVVAASGVQTTAKKKRGAVIQDNLVSEVVFCSLNAKDPRSVAFITRDRNNISMCHFYKIKGGAEAMHSAIGTAFNYDLELQERNVDNSERSLYARRTTSLTGQISDGGLKSGEIISEDTEVEPGRSAGATAGASKLRDVSEVLGTYEVMYFGSLPCQEMRGQHVVLQKLGMMLHSGKMQPQEVALQITGEGIKAIDVINSTPLMISSMISVSFTTTIQDKNALKALKQQNKEYSHSVFAYILKDDRLSRLTCSLFGCRNVKTSNDIAQAVNKAFQIQVEIKKLRQGDPFAAVSSKRDTVPMTLFPIQIHRVDLKASKVIGMGQFGEVYLATQKMLDPETMSEAGSEIRAVKILRNSAGAADRNEFLREAEVMVKLKHANLVRLVGVAVQQRPWLTVLEYVRYGDMLAVVKTAAEKAFEIQYTEHLHWTQQMADGMAYISSRNMIHMDLAARNVLLGQNNNVKIADFGLTRELPPGKPYYRLMQTLKLPIKWMAIESIRDKIFTVKTDVWGFGIMVWEILSYGEIPYGDVKNIEVEKLVGQGMRLQCVDGCPQELHNLLSKCWLPHPAQRPNFQQIYAATKVLVEKASGNYPPPRSDVGAALHNEKLGPADAAVLKRDANSALAAAAAAIDEEEFVIQDEGAVKWQQQEKSKSDSANGSVVQLEKMNDDAFDSGDDEMDI